MASELLLLAFLFLTASLLLSISSKRLKDDPKSKHRHLQLPPSPGALPIIGHFHLIGPLIHQSFRDLSARFGPLMYLRLGNAKFVVVNSPKYAKHLFKTNEVIFPTRQMNNAIKLVTYENASFAFGPQDAYWKFMKKLSTTELLSNRNIRQFMPIRTTEVHQFVQNLVRKSEAKESVNLTVELMKVSNNIISRMILSIKSSDKQGEEARSVIRDVTQIFGEFNVSDFIGFCKNLDLQGFKKRAMNIHKRFDALLEKIISDREQLRRKQKATTEVEAGEAEEKLRDFLDMLLDVAEHNDCEVTITRNHIKSLILDFLVAGTDTSAISVEWALSEFINNPRVLKKAQEEVDRVIGDKRLVCESDIQNLPYIQAIIKETMRLHPPITLITRTADQDSVVDRYLIPKGSFVCVNLWAMGRDPNLWEKPLEFRPERFLEGEGSNLDIKGHHFELLPFGTGRRGCPGLPLAMQELYAVMGILIQCFTWKALNKDGKIMADGESLDMDERPGLTAPRARDLFCIPVLRVNPTPFLQP